MNHNTSSPATTNNTDYTYYTNSDDYLHRLKPHMNHNASSTDTTNNTGYTNNTNHDDHLYEQALVWFSNNYKSTRADVRSPFHCKMASNCVFL